MTDYLAGNPPRWYWWSPRWWWWLLTCDPKDWTELDASPAAQLQRIGHRLCAADRDRARAVTVALEQELAEVRSAFREVLALHEQPPREDAEGVYPWFSGDIGVDEMAGYRALLGDGA